MEDLATLKGRYDLRAIIPPGTTYRDMPGYRAQLCLWHDEERPSLLVYPDGYRCKACGARGDIIDWYRFAEHLSFPDALKKLSGGEPVSYHAPKRKVRTTLSPGLALDYHFNLTDHALRYYKSRGLDTDTVVRFQLGYGPPPGHTEPRFALPVYEEERLVNIKFRRDDSCPRCKGFSVSEDHLKLSCLECRHEWRASDDHKYLGMAGGEPALFNSRYLYKGAEVDRLLITEGEFDAMSAAQAGFRATCSTGGANAFHRSWADLFRAVRRAYVIYDNDDAGTEGRKKVRTVLPRARDVYLPVARKGDLNDYLRDHPAADLDRLLKVGLRVQQNKEKFAVVASHRRAGERFFSYF